VGHKSGKVGHCGKYGRDTELALYHNLLSASMQKRLNPSDYLGVKTILVHLSDEESMIDFAKCFGVVQIDTVGVVPIGRVLQYVIEMMEKLCSAAMS
jgi:hypothetical protein